MHTPLFAVPVLLLGMVMAGTFSVGAAVSSLVSGTTRVGASAGGGSYQPVLSDDGRFVVFVSDAGNLVPNVTWPERFNVYLRDRILSETWLISVSTNGSGGQGSSVGPTVSADGRFVGFQSWASDLSPRDTNGLSDVFLHDRQSGTTELVSRKLDGWSSSSRASAVPLLSWDGRHLLFESDATSIVANDTNNAGDIFWYERETGARSLVSVNDEGTGSRAGLSRGAVMSASGQWVAYENWLSNGVTLHLRGQVYLYELTTGKSHWASAGVATNLYNYLGSAWPVWGRAGTSVWFYGFNHAGTNLYRFDPSTAMTTLMLSNIQGRSPVALSADERYVGFESNNLVHVLDADGGSIQLISQSPEGQPAPSRGGPAWPVLSDDGTKITFLSSATNLLAELSNTNGYTQIYQRNLASGTWRWLNGGMSRRVTADLSAILPAVSRDGNLVAFETTATDLAADDLNAASDVFLRDVIEEFTTLVSSRHAERPSETAASALLYRNSTSADGRWVAFVSTDRADIPADTNSMSDIFVRDRQTGEIQPVSLEPLPVNYRSQAHTPTLSRDGRYIAWATAMPTEFEIQSAFILWKDRQTGETRTVSDTFNSGTTLGVINANPAISPDGRWVAFSTTRRTEFHAPWVWDRNSSSSDVVLQDVLAGTNLIISVDFTGTQTGRYYSTAPQFSPDGHWLAFVSAATDLTLNPTEGVKLFLRDLRQHRTLDVSAGVFVGLPDLPPIYKDGAVFSQDSQWLAYQALGRYVGLYHVPTGIRSNVCARCESPSLSGDGRLLAVTQSHTIGGLRVNVFDRATGGISVVGTNVQSAAQPEGRDQTRRPWLSGDGRYLIFRAQRVPSAPLDSPGLYVRDLLWGITAPLSVNTNGGFANESSYAEQLTEDGRTVVYLSFASDLVKGDYNRRADVFAVRIGADDADRDRLDDDWEMAHFNDLTRDGAGDFDRDGHTDQQEFQAGTDPTNRDSVLSLLVTTGEDNVILTWNSVIGRTYRVEFKPEMTNAWAVLSAGLVAEASSQSLTIPNREPRQPRGFYRVVHAP
jgi:Tol biopolymer transport system component